jgi:hypothetical protein
MRRNGFDPSKNFNYIVNRSEKGTLCKGILFDAQTYSYKSYKDILSNTLKRGNDLEVQGYEVIDIQVDTYVSFLSGFAKEGINIVNNELNNQRGGGKNSALSLKKKRKSKKNEKQTQVSVSPMSDPVAKNEDGSIQTKKSFNFLSGAFLTFLGLLSSVENTTSIILFRRRGKEVQNNSISCKYIKSKYMHHETIIQDFLNSYKSDEKSISFNFDTFKDMIFGTETTYLTLFYRSTEKNENPVEIHMVSKDIKEKLLNLIQSFIKTKCRENFYCSLFTNWKDVEVSISFGCMINYYKYATYDNILKIAKTKCSEIKGKILSIQIDTFSYDKLKEVTYVAIFYEKEGTDANNDKLSYSHHSSVYKYHTEIYSDLSKSHCKQIDSSKKVSINIDSWTRFTETTNVTLFYHY